MSNGNAPTLCVPSTTKRAPTSRVRMRISGRLNLVPSVQWTFPSATTFVFLSMASRILSFQIFPRSTKLSGGSTVFTLALFSAHNRSPCIGVARKLFRGNNHILVSDQSLTLFCDACQPIGNGRYYRYPFARFGFDQSSKLFSQYFRTGKKFVRGDKSCRISAFLLIPSMPAFSTARSKGDMYEQLR